MTDTDPAASVRQAEQEAAEAETLAATLAERVRNGEDISPDELDSAEKLGRFARLRVEAAQRKAAKAREEERQRKLADLAVELRAHETDPAAFDQMLTDIETAVTAFAQACADRDADVRRFREQMMQLGVPSVELPNGLIPAKEHAHLGWSKNSGQIIVGGRRLTKVEAGPILAAAIQLIAERFDLQVGGRSFTSILPALQGIHGRRDPHDYLGEQA